MVFFSNLYYYYIFTIVIYLIVYYTYYISTKFTKTITVKHNNIMNIQKQIYNFVVDQDNVVYVIDNRYPLLHFNAAELMSTVKVNKTFNISGYGLRVPFLELYPNILSMNEIK